MLVEQWMECRSYAYRLARSKGVKPSFADDVAQTACVLLASRLKQGKGATIPQASRFALLKHFDAFKRLPVAYVDIATTPSQSASETLDGLRLNKREQAICECLQTGMTQRETAERLGLSAGTVNSTISGIRSRITEQQAD